MLPIKKQCAECFLLCHLTNTWKWNLWNCVNFPLAMRSMKGSRQVSMQWMKKGAKSYMMFQCFSSSCIGFGIQQLKRWSWGYDTILEAERETKQLLMKGDDDDERVWMFVSGKPILFLFCFGRKKSWKLNWSWSEAGFWVFFKWIVEGFVSKLSLRNCKKKSHN